MLTPARTIDLDDQTRRIEPATIEDMEALVDVYCIGVMRTKCGQKSQKKFGKNYHKGIAEEGLLAAFANTNAEVFKCVRGLTVDGMVNYKKEPAERTMHIDQLYTRDERQGIGKELMHHVFHDAQQSKIKKITLLARDEAMPFYRYFGFNDFGRKMTLYL